MKRLQQLCHDLFPKAARGQFLIGFANRWVDAKLHESYVNSHGVANWDICFQEEFVNQYVTVYLVNDVRLHSVAKQNEIDAFFVYTANRQLKCAFLSGGDAIICATLLEEKVARQQYIPPLSKVPLAKPVKPAPRKPILVDHPSSVKDLRDWWDDFTDCWDDNDEIDDWVKRARRCDLGSDFGQE